MKQVRFGLLALLACASLSCSGSDDTGRNYSSGVTAPGPVSMLDTADKQKLCQTFDSYVTTNLDFTDIAYAACIPAAIWTTTSVEACNASLNNCIALFPKPIAVNAMVRSETECFDSLEQCQATVAQVEGCVDIHLDRALSIINQWTCELARNPEDRKIAEPTPSTVQVCSDINAACNNFADVNAGPD